MTTIEEIKAKFKAQRGERIKDLGEELQKFVFYLERDVLHLIKKRSDKFQKKHEGLAATVAITSFLNIGESLMKIGLDCISSSKSSFILGTEEGNPTDFIKQRIKDMWKETIGEEF